MIKFFKKIRLGLLTENRFSKYLIYAIGEIVLVVIGILIAVQINNWNESKKQAENQKYIYKAIIGDLKRDNQEVDIVIEEFSEKLKTINKILNKTQDREEYIDCTSCQEIITGFPDFALQTRGYNLLNNNLSPPNLNSDSIKEKINAFYNKSKLEIEMDQSFLSNDLQNNYNYWKNNCDWWADFTSGVLNTNFIEYSLNSVDYRNRVATYKTVAIGLYLPKLKLFKKESQELITVLIKDINDN